MNEMKSSMRPALSRAGFKVLGRLQRSCAYQVHGAWRFRGMRNRVKEPTILALLARGLAERVETDRQTQVRITPAGRWVNSDVRRARSLSNLDRL
jgi:hypothetical protein